MFVRRLAAGLVGVVLVAGCSGGDDGDGDASSPADTTAPTSTSTSTPTSTSASAPEAAPASTSPPTSAPPSPGPADGGADRAVLPDAVGMDLQLAQDTMQAAGFYLLTSHDATGQDRFQVVDRNWTVCSQDPPGDTEASPETPIDFGAVKDDETCP